MESGERGRRKQRKDGRARADEKLGRELPWIVSYCVGRYEKVAKDKLIPTCRDELLELSDSYDAEYLDLLDTNFIFDVDPKTSEFRTTPQELKNFMETKGYRNPQIQKKIKELLRDRNGITATRPRGKDGRIPYFYGMKRRAPNPNSTVSGG